MYNMDEEQTALKLLAADTYDNLNRINKEAICLMNDQARHIYKKVESESIINIDTINQEREADKLNNNNLEED